MYDAKTEPHEFVGETREDAIQKARKFFGLEEDELSIGGFAPADVYGAGGRVVIVAAPRDRPAPAHGGPRGARAAREPREPREARDREPREDRGGRRGRGRGGRGGEGRSRERRERPARREPPASSEPSVGTASGELSELGSFVLGAVERMDLGPFEISESEDAGVVAVELRGAAALELAKGEGRTVDALQLLVNQVSMRSGDDRRRVVVDVEGDVESREVFLTSLATRVAQRARDSGRAVALDPMSPKDRRAIHVALRDEDGIATMSIGEGRYRQVVVVPEGAPEYDEAQSQAERSDS